MREIIKGTRTWTVITDTAAEALAAEDTITGDYLIHENNLREMKTIEGFVDPEVARTAIFSRLSR